MKIAIYTSESRGSINSYNISQLLTHRPQYQYKVVIVRDGAFKISWIDRLKRYIVELRDGRNYMRRDIAQLEKKVIEQCTVSDFSHLSVVYVPQVNDTDSQNSIKEFAPDIILQAGAGILKKEIFGLANIATINVHHGYAPEIRGILSTFWCLYYGLTDRIGVTCHKVDETLDTGDVICQYQYPYQPGDTFIHIQEVLIKKGAEVLVKSIDLLGVGEHIVRQTEEVNSYYFSKVDYRKYTALMNQKFMAVESSNHLKTKKKMKVFCFDQSVTKL